MSYEGSKSTPVPLVSRRVLHLKSVPRPVWDAEAVRHILGGLVVAGHRCRGRPGEVVMQHAGIAAFLLLVRSGLPVAKAVCGGLLSTHQRRCIEQRRENHRVRRKGEALAPY
jgi:hypothetical protein